MNKKYEHREALPCAIDVKSKDLITVTAAIGVNENIQFSLTDEEIVKFWDMIEAARKAALARIFQQNI